MDRRGLKRCPYCQELIKAEAIKCRYCAEWLDVPLESPAAPPDDEETPLPERGPRQATRRSGSPASPGPSRARPDLPRPPRPARVEPDEEEQDEAADLDGDERSLAPAAAKPRPKAAARPAPSERGRADGPADEEDDEPDNEDRESEGDEEGEQDEDQPEEDQEDEDEDEDEDEPVIFQGGISRLLLTVPALLLFLWVTLGVFLYLRGGALFTEHPWLRNIGQFVGLGGAFVLGLVLLKRWLGLRKRSFYITSWGIEFQDGVLAKSIEGIEMWRVQDLSFAQTTRQALIGLGTITVHSSDKTHPMLTIGPIRRARRVFTELKRAQQAAQRQGGVLRVEN